MSTRRFFSGFLLALIVASLGWQLGVQMERQRFMRDREAFEAQFGLAGSGMTFKEDPEKEVDMGLFWIVWRMLDQHYVDPSALTIDDLRFGAMKGLVSGLKDPYSGFMTPQESDDFQGSLEGKLEGIGAELTLRDGAIVVVGPSKGLAWAASRLPPARHHYPR